MFAMLLTIYISGLCLVAATYALYLVHRIDRYFLRACDFGCWAVMPVVAVLWPALLFLKPQALYRPSITLATTIERATQQRQRSKLWNSPPYCSGFVKYEKFTFPASDVEAALEAKVSEHEKSMREIFPDYEAMKAKGKLGYPENNDEVSLLRWVQRRDESDPNSTPVPDEWSRFVFTADKLARSGKGEAHCDQCGESIPCSDLIADDDQFRVGTNKLRLRCPKGHVIFDSWKMHIDGWEDESQVPNFLKNSRSNQSATAPTGSD